MLTIANRNSQGYFKVYGDGGRLLTDRTCGVTCSEYIKQTYSNGILKGKIVFYYPSDWLCNPGRNLKFFEYWLDLVKRLFWEVKVIGKVKTSDMGRSFTSMYGQSNSNFGKGLDLGDYIFNDEWYMFEIDIDSNSNATQMKQYCAYCMIRYLFSDHYDQIIKTYNRIRGLVLALGMREITEFEILQMAHFYFAGYNGYYPTYCLVYYLNRDAKIHKLIKKEEFDTKVRSETIVNSIFLSISPTINNSGAETQITITDFQKALEQNNLSFIYGKIK